MKITHLTNEQLAERLHLHPNTLVAWRIRGVGPRFIKAGKKVLYPIPEIEKWETESIRTSTVNKSLKSTS